MPHSNMLKDHWAIDVDDNGNWHLFPVERRDEWRKWFEIGQENGTYDYWRTPPGFSIMFSDFTKLTFTTPTF